MPLSTIRGAFSTSMIPRRRWHISPNRRRSSVSTVTRMCRSFGRRAFLRSMRGGLEKGGDRDSAVANCHDCDANGVGADKADASGQGLKDEPVRSAGVANRFPCPGTRSAPPLPHESLLFVPREFFPKACPATTDTDPLAWVAPAGFPDSWRQGRHRGRRSGYVPSSLRVLRPRAFVSSSSLAVEGRERPFWISRRASSFLPSAA